jgi:hypothetical protein
MFGKALFEQGSLGIADGPDERFASIECRYAQRVFRQRQHLRLLPACIAGAGRLRRK